MYAVIGIVMLLFMVYGFVGFIIDIKRFIKKKVGVKKDDSEEHIKV